MIVDPLIRLIKDHPEFRNYHVDGVESLADIDNLLRRLPACFVVPTAESAAANRLAAGAIDQKVTLSFSLVSVLKNPKTGDLHRIETALKGLLPGFIDRDRGYESPVEYVGQNILRVRDYLGTELKFRTTYHLRKTGA